MLSREAGNRLYRRGLILGWTLGEIFFLFVFALLFVLTAQMMHNRGNQNPNLAEQNRRLREQLAERERERDQLREKNRQLQTDLAPYRKISDDFNDLILAAPGASEADKMSALLKEARDAHKLRAALERSHLTLDQAGQLAHNNEDLKHKLDSATGQAKNCEHRIAAIAAGGRDKRPCWVDAQGNVKFIFDLALTSDGIELRREKVADVAPDENTLPLQEMKFGRPLDEGTFIAETQQLYDWSEQNDCRFYVRVCDLTEAGEKTLYKLLLRDVEDRFYIKMQNECGGWRASADTGSNTR